MSILRTYLSLLVKNRLILLGYTLLFLFLVFMIGGSSAPGGQTAFEKTRLNLALSLPEETHEQGGDFADWLEDQGHAVSRLSLTEDQARQAVFEQLYDVVYLFSQEDPRPLALTDQRSAAGHFALSIAESYFRYRDAFQDQAGSWDQKAFVEVMELEMPVKMAENPGHKEGDAAARLAFFSSLAYILLLMSTSLVPLVNQAFSTAGVRSRTTLSAYPARRLAFGLFLGSGLVVGGTAILLFLLSLVISWPHLVGPTGALLLNYLVFTLAALAFSYLLSSLFQKKAVITAVSTALSLGIAFLSGAFVPQAIMGSVALTLARAFPLYYFIHAVPLAETPARMAPDLLIQLAFALAYFALAFLALRWSRRARKEGVF